METVKDMNESRCRPQSDAWNAHWKMLVDMKNQIHDDVTCDEYRVLLGQFRALGDQTVDSKYG